MKYLLIIFLAFEVLAQSSAVIITNKSKRGNTNPPNPDPTTYADVYYFHADSARNTPQHFNALIDSLVAGDTVVVDGLTWTIEDSTDVLRIRDISGTDALPIVFSGINGTKITTWVGLPALTWTQYVDDLWFDYDRDDVEDGGESYHVADTIWYADFQFSGSYDANGRYIRVKADNGSGFNELEYGNTDGVTGEAGKLKRYDNYTFDEYNWFVNSQKRIGMWPEGNEIYLYCPPGTDPNNDNDAYDSLMFIGQISQVNGVWDDSSRCVIHVANANYITINGFRIEGGIEHQILVEDCKRLTISNNDLLWCGEYGISVGVNYARNIGAQNCDSLLVEDNVIDSYDRTYFGASNNTTRMSVNALNMFAYTDDAGTSTRYGVIQNNTIRGYHADILIGENSNSSNTYGYGGNHTITNNNISAYKTKYSKPLQINGSDNIDFFNNKIDSCSAPIQMNCWIDDCATPNYPRNIKIGFNTFRFTDSLANVHDSGYDGYLGNGGHNIYIFNNTFYNMYEEFGNQEYSLSDSITYFYNNAFIFSKRYKTSYNQFFWLFNWDGNYDVYGQFWSNNAFCGDDYNEATTYLFKNNPTGVFYTFDEFETWNDSSDCVVTGNFVSTSAYSSIINTTTLEVVAGSPLLYENNPSVSIEALVPVGFKDRFNHTVNRAQPNIGADDGNP